MFLKVKGNLIYVLLKHKTIKTLKVALKVFLFFFNLNNTQLRALKYLDIIIYRNFFYTNSEIEMVKLILSFFFFFFISNK